MQDIKTGHIVIDTQKEFQVLDITEPINRVLRNDCNFCNVFVQHTTAAIGIIDIDKGTQVDFVNSLNQILPKIEFTRSYNPDHMSAHILATIIGMSISLPVSEGNLQLGSWQRLVLIELNGPRSRSIAVTGLR